MERRAEVGRNRGRAPLKRSQRPARYLQQVRLLKHSFMARILHQSTKQSKVEFRSLDSGRASPSGWPLASQNTIAARAVATRADFAKCALPWPETGDAP